MVLFFENRELVIPGELIAKGDYIEGENTFDIDDKIYATRIGLVECRNKKVSVVALRSFYIPAINDIVIGKIVEVKMRGWIVDIRSPLPALLRVSDSISKPFNPKDDELTSILDTGDLIIAKIISYDRTRDPLLTIRDRGLGKIREGQIVIVTPSKIPRIIGRRGSMIDMLKMETECKITVGQNGVILVKGKSPTLESLAIRGIRMIESEAHTSGLTARVTEIIKKRKEELMKGVLRKNGRN